MIINVNGLTDVGKKRGHNEDSLLVFHNEKMFIAAVCDGLGGHAHGEVASKMMVDYLRDWARELGKHKNDAKLKDIIEQCNVDMRRSLNGGGTTLAMIARKSKMDKCIVVHAGDSRVYRIRGSQIKQLTSDHSLVQKLIDCGDITEVEARTHPNKNVILSHVGQGTAITVSSTTVTLQPNDTFVICSDGLTNEVCDRDILNTVLKYGKNTEKAVKDLVNHANNAGGKDNITAIVCRFEF